MDLTTSSTLQAPRGRGQHRGDARGALPPRPPGPPHLGLMRLATTMMSPRLEGDLTRAPEPMVMATSFSVSVWQICGVREVAGWLLGTLGTAGTSGTPGATAQTHLQDGDAVRDQAPVDRRRRDSRQTLSSAPCPRHPPSTRATNPTMAASRPVGMSPHREMPGDHPLLWGLGTPRALLGTGGLGTSGVGLTRRPRSSPRSPGWPRCAGW